MRGSRAGFQPKARSTRARVKFAGGGAGAMRLPNLRAAITYSGGGGGALATFQSMSFTGGGAGALQMRTLIQFTGGGSGFLAVDTATPTYPNGFKHYLEFLIPDDNVLGTGALNNYLGSIDDTFAELRTVANGGLVDHASGFDMQMELADGTVIPFARLAWDATTGRIVARPRWASMPAAGSRYRLFFGKTVVTDGASEAGAYAAHLMAPNMRTGADRTGLGRGWTTGVATSSTIVQVHSLIGLTRAPANILAPTAGQLTNDEPANADADDNQNFNSITGFTSGTNKTLDLRGHKFYHHSLVPFSGDGNRPGQNSPIRPTGFGTGMCIYGAEIIGEQSDSTDWADMKTDNPAAMDDNGILYPNPSVPAAATVYIEACIFRKQFDGINTDPRYGANRANKGHYIVRGCYAEKQRDEFIENDSCQYLEVYDCLVDSCHNFISMRPGGDSDAIPPDYSSQSNWVKVENTLARCRGQYFNQLLGGDSLPARSKRFPQWEEGNSSAFVSNPNSFGPGYVHREPFKGSGVETFTNLNCTIWVDCKHSMFAFESFPTAGKVVFPPGLYDDVWLLYLPDLGSLSIGDFVDSRYVQDRGITVLAGAAARDKWNAERAAWIAAHGGYTSGGLLRFPFTEVP